MHYVLQDTQEKAAQEVREAMYSVADRYQILAPSSFAATQMLGSLGQGIVPSLLSREVGPVRASLNFLHHALTPLTATEDVKKVCLYWTWISALHALSQDFDQCGLQDLSSNGHCRRPNSWIGLQTSHHQTC